MSRYSKLLSEFLASPLEFQLIGQPINSAKVLVLDSSFNPPHIAHAELIAHAFRNAKQRTEQPQVMLLLSVNNADKAPTPASFTDRLEMMGLMSRWLEKKCNCQVAIGLTKKAKFVDKASAINYKQGRLEFLVGFDTLERIVDQKYYTKPVSQILSPFFDSSDIFCLTRAGSVSNEKQNEVVDQLNSEYASRPITMVNDDAMNDVSSSKIRKHRKLDDQWKHWVIPDIAHYIETHDLYL